MTKTNTLFTKPFFTTFFWKQNKHHQYGVFLYMLKVAWYALMHKPFLMILKYPAKKKIIIFSASSISKFRDNGDFI